MRNILILYEEQIYFVNIINMYLKISILIVFCIIFLFFVYYLFTKKYNDNRYITSDEFDNFMNIILEKKNNDKVFNNYIKTNYNNTVTYKQLNYALDKINNETIANVHKNFLSSEECKFIIKYCQDKLQDSGVFLHNETIIDNKSRTSKTYFTNINDNEIIKHIKNRIIKFLNIDSNKIEELQITKYNKGDYYKLHHDYIKEFINKRKYSVIIYLNTLEHDDGGATFFPFYKQRIIPEEGTLIYFDNVFDDNSDNFLTLHESQDIKKNKDKYIITVWTRIYNI